MISSGASTLVGLPPPLRGRVGERGMPRAQVDEIQRASARRLKRTTKSSQGVVIATRQAAEQAAPPTLTLPRKGGGNGACRVPGNKEGKL